MRIFLNQKLWVILLIMSLLTGCSDPDDVRYKNPYLPNVNVVLQLDLNLPEYNSLQFPGNKYVTYSQGIEGVVVYCISPDVYKAFELTDPNHIPQDCSRLTVTGIEAACSCDENVYEIISGQSVNGQTEFPLKPYRIEKIGSVLQITNY